MYYSSGHFLDYCTAGTAFIQFFSNDTIFFSLLRKVFIVVPLTLLLPKVGFGVMGVFMAEPISNVIGGLASTVKIKFLIY